MSAESKNKKGGSSGVGLNPHRQLGVGAPQHHHFPLDADVHGHEDPGPTGDNDKMTLPKYRNVELCKCL